MRNLIIAVLVLVHTAALLAQPRTLTYEEAVSIALQKNVDFNVQHNEVDRALSQRMQSIANLGPNVSVSADFFDRRGRQQIQNPETNQVEFLDVISNNISGNFNANITLFNGLNKLQTYRSQQSNVQAQEFGLERARQNTVFNVAQQYLQVLLSEELYRIAQDNYRNQTENLKRIQGQVEVGALGIVDQYNQTAEVKRLESLVIRAKNNYENDKLILAQTLQLEPGTDFVLVNPNYSIEYTLNLQVDLDDLYQTALTIPFSRNDQLRDVNPYQFYGFSLTVPIMNGFSSRVRVQTAKIDRDNSMLQESNLKTVIYRDVKAAYQNFEAAKANYLSSVAQYEAADAAYKLAKERYELGLSTFVEFSQASNALILGQAAKAQSEYTLMFQETILNYQIGQLK